MVTEQLCRVTAGEKQVRDGAFPAHIPEAITLDAKSELFTEHGRHWRAPYKAPGAGGKAPG